MSYNHHLPKKIDLTPKKHHGFQFLLFLCGVLLPPIAVALRFGIGTDFFINVFLTICGYIPSHFHNFYIQNIRNNTNKARTPKWALKAGLIDRSDLDRRTKKSEWSKRYNERNHESAHVGQALEDGEEGDNYVPQSEREIEAANRRREEGLWDDRADAEYYNEDQAPNQRHWHYPANFEGAVVEGGSKHKKKQQQQGDRWERTKATRTNSNSSGSAYPPAGMDDDVPEWGRDYGSKSKKDKKKAQAAAKSSGGQGGWASNNNHSLIDDLDNGYGGGRSGDRQGGGYDRREEDYGRGGNGGQQQKKTSGRSDDVFNHEF